MSRVKISLLPKSMIGSLCIGQWHCNLGPSSPTMLQLNFWRETLPQNVQGAQLRFVFCLFLFRAVLLEKLIHTRISERDFNKGISAGASTGWFGTFTDTFFFLQFTTAGLVCCLPITRLQIPPSSKTVGRNKYEAKDSETSRTQICAGLPSDIYLKLDLWDYWHCNSKDFYFRWWRSTIQRLC